MKRRFLLYFLSKVVRQDDLLPQVLQVFREYREVKQAWDVFAAWGDWASRRQHTCARLWAPALRRVIEEGQGSDLERFELALTIFDSTQDPHAAPLLDEAIEQLRAGCIESEEATHASSLLEDRVFWDLPMDVADRAHEALSLVIADCLEQSGGYMSIEDLETVISNLCEFGAQDERASEAVGKAVEGFLDNIGDTLDDVHALAELKEFETEVRRIADAYFRFDACHERHFATRRKELREREESAGEYRGGWTRPEPTMNDDETRSMFATLRNEQEH